MPNPPRDQRKASAPASRGTRRGRLFGNRFLGAQGGGVAVVFALSLLTLSFFVGMAVDVGAMFSAKSKLDAITDSASLAGASSARADLLSSGLGNSGKTSAVLDAATKTASSFFSSQASDLSSVTATASASVKLVNGEITSTVSYRATYRPHLMTLFGYTEINIVGEAVSAASVVPFMEVTLLVDTSGSMAIGADAAGQTLLKSQIGCAFACHDNVAVNGYADSYAYAKGKGITLRYDSINQGIRRLIDEFDTLDPGAASIKASIVSFDTKFTVKQAMTASRSQLRWNLPTAPAMSGETDGATKFAEGIASVVKSVGTGGTGATAKSPVKLVILATDGVQDPGRFWVTQTSYRKEVAQFDMSFCETLKSRNIRVGILHTPYIPMPDDWGYMATLAQPSLLGNPGTRADDVPRVLKACAGDLYFEAGTSSKIVEGFVSILRSASTTPRLVM